MSRAGTSMPSTGTGTLPSDARWPPLLPRSPRRSASRRSATSSRCSRTTFDPAALEERAAALEHEMGEPGLWDEPERARRTGEEHARTTRRLETFRALERDVDDLEALAE